MPINAKPKPRILVARIAAALLGGYALCWGFIALGVAGLFALGMPFHDAEQMANILAFLLYLVIVLWAFATPHLMRAWLLLLGGGGLMAGFASLLQRLLTAPAA